MFKFLYSMQIVDELKIFFANFGDCSDIQKQFGKIHYHHLSAYNKEASWVLVCNCLTGF